MYQTIFTGACTAIGGGIGSHFDSPVIGAFIGFAVGIALITGAIGELAECIVNCID